MLTSFLINMLGILINCLASFVMFYNVVKLCAKSQMILCVYNILSLPHLYHIYLFLLLRFDALVHSMSVPSYNGILSLSII